MVLALDSSFQGAKDCYSIKPTAENQSFELLPLIQISAGPPTTDLVVVVSREYSTVALLDSNGTNLSSPAQ